jgi:mRNA-degrading endonuclease RelE of RelBE toxin-antitoxin system
MPKRWTLRTHPQFQAALRQIPRGLAGLISDVIWTLERDPYPPTSEPVEGQEGRHRIVAYGYAVYYEVIEDARIINLLLMQKEE